MRYYVCSLCGNPDFSHTFFPDRADGDGDAYGCPTGQTRAYFADFRLEAGPAQNPAPATMRKMVYIAGPISKGDLAHNINQATAAFLKLAQAGLAPLCPHWSAFSSGALVAPTSGQVYAIATAGGCGLSHADWLAVDLAFVERSAAVLRLPGESKGADMEVRHALARGIPVFEDADRLIRSMRYFEPSSFLAHDLGGEG